MLNRKDYRKYWIKLVDYKHPCDSCDLISLSRNNRICLAEEDNEFDCFDDNGNKKVIFKLIKKEAK